MTASCFSLRICTRTGGECNADNIVPSRTGNVNRHNAFSRARLPRSVVYSGREYISRYGVCINNVIYSGSYDACKKIRSFSLSLWPESTSPRSYISTPGEIFMQRMVIWSFNPRQRRESSEISFFDNNRNSFRYLFRGALLSNILYAKDGRQNLL